MLADALCGADKPAVARAFVERLERGRHFAPQPFVEAIDLQRPERVCEAITAAELRRPLVGDAGHDLAAVCQENRTEERSTDKRRLKPVVAVPVDGLMQFAG